MGVWYILGWGLLRREASGHLPPPFPSPMFCSLKVSVSVLWALECVCALDCVWVSLCI